MDCTLFCATAVSQPFVYQLLPHSFHLDGGCTPSLSIPELAIRHSPLATVFKPFLFKFLRILLRFFALAKNSTLLFSMNSALFAKKHGEGGGV